jgi:hypothetical protein
MTQQILEEIKDEMKASKPKPKGKYNCVCRLNNFSIAGFTFVIFIVTQNILFYYRPDTD